MLETSLECVPLERFEIDEASDSSVLDLDEPEETLDEACLWARMTETSGALYVSMLVVLNNCMGPEIFLISIGFSLKRMLADRGGNVGVLSVVEETVFLRRKVNARAIDDILTAIGSKASA